MSIYYFRLFLFYVSTTYSAHWLLTNRWIRWEFPNQRKYFILLGPFTFSRFSILNSLSKSSQELLLTFTGITEAKRTITCTNETCHTTHMQCMYVYVSVYLCAQFLNHSIVLFFLILLHFKKDKWSSETIEWFFKVNRMIWRMTHS